MRDIKELLNDSNNFELKEWAGNKSWQEIYKCCHRGDWLLLLLQKANPEDIQLLTLAKGHCANTVRHLMTDNRSIAAVDAAIAFGNNKITKEQLADTISDAFIVGPAAAALAAYNAANFITNAYVTDTFHATYYAAYCAAIAASSTAANIAAGRIAVVAAFNANQLLTANIVRDIVPIDSWNISN